jgi:membrane fusion protein (multidrug efflux system)
MASTAPTTPTITEARTVSPKPAKKNKALRAYIVLGLLASSALAAYFIHGFLTRDEVSTDDAQVDADVVPIASRVGGVVVELDVQDNAPIKAKQTLAVIDQADYQAKLAAAKADLAAAQAQAEAADSQVDIVKSTAAGGLSSARAQLTGTGASVQSARAQVQAASAQVARATTELTKAESDLNRATKLHDQGAITAQDLETAQTAHDGARANLDSANASLASARDQQAVAESRIAEAQGKVQQSAPVDQQVAAAVAQAKLAHARADSSQSAVKLAELQLGYTTITAPVDGYASKLAVHTGQLIQPGTMLVMVVPAKSYVVANFKETQIERIRAGNPVDITIDALGGTFHGKVASLSAATGARFSMMPPDNATGNFVKVVQRVPVKIALDDDQDLSGLHAGLSAEVTVHLR